MTLHKLYRTFHYELSKDTGHYCSKNHSPNCTPGKKCKVSNMSHVQERVNTNFLPFLFGLYDWCITLEKDGAKGLLRLVKRPVAYRLVKYVFIFYSPGASCKLIPELLQQKRVQRVLHRFNSTEEF